MSIICPLLDFCRIAPSMHHPKPLKSLSPITTPHFKYQIPGDSIKKIRNKISSKSRYSTINLKFTHLTACNFSNIQSTYDNPFSSRPLAPTLKSHFSLCTCALNPLLSQILVVCDVFKRRLLRSHLRTLCNLD